MNRDPGVGGQAWEEAAGEVGGNSEVDTGQEVCLGASEGRRHGKKGSWGYSRGEVEAWSAVR